MRRQVVGRFAVSLAVSLVLATGSHCGDPGVLQDPRETLTHRTLNPAAITIRIHNYAQVRAPVMKQAIRTASDIFREAGVDSVWVECSFGQTFSLLPSCANPVTSLDLILNVVPHSRKANFRFQDEVLGVAMETTAQAFGTYASVFYDRVALCAVERGLDLSHLLGTVIAHELGHLLLGANSHSGYGVMRASWSLKELIAAGWGGLIFSAAEEQQLRTALTTRGQAAFSGREVY